MKVLIPGNSETWADRSGYAPNYPTHMRQQMLVRIADGEIVFEDELDAVNMAKAILERMGEKYP